jgi:hypothetical protein
VVCAALLSHVAAVSISDVSNLWWCHQSAMQDMEYLAALLKDIAVKCLSDEGQDQVKQHHV